MSTTIRNFDDVRDDDALSAEEIERAAYLEEVVQKSTQFGLGNWHYEGTHDFSNL